MRSLSTHWVARKCLFHVKIGPDTLVKIGPDYFVGIGQGASAQAPLLCARFRLGDIEFRIQYTSRPEWVCGPCDDRGETDMDRHPIRRWSEGDLGS